MTDTAPKPARPEWLDRAEEAKLLAEAEEVAAKANLHRAEASKHNVEAEKLAAEARISHAVASESEARAAKAQIDREREEHKRRKELVADEFHHVYTFDTVVTDTSVSACQKQMSIWERLADKPISVVLRINSPGGGIFEGFALVDYLEGMMDRGHTVDTHAYGMAASMGGVLLQVGKTRKMGKSAHLLIHEAQFRTGGKTGDVEDEMKLVHMLQDRILDMYADRAKGSAAAKPMTRNQIKRNWYRRDWWIPAGECLRHGFIDEIA